MTAPLHIDLTTRLIRRFIAKTSLSETECVLWKGATAGTGLTYGNFKVGKRTMLAHRVAYEIFRGPIPQGLCVLHKCDVPTCVNPAHLFLGTRQDNMDDRNQKGRQASGERQGRAKLSYKIVREMRKAYAAGATQSALARKYGISTQNARLAILGVTWKGA